MSANLDENDRHIFPRWRSFKATSSLGELDQPSVTIEKDTSSLDISLAQGIARWEASPSLWRGLDVLGAAIVAGKLDSFGALIEEVKTNPLAPTVARRLLEKRSELSSDPTNQPQRLIDALGAQDEIQLYRRRLGEGPRDPIGWVELARAFTIAGENPKGEKAMLAALQLAPNNRFVLRSAARFFIHVGQLDRAYELLNKSSVLNKDPWLLASELAIGAALRKGPKNVRAVRSSLAGDTPPSELSELAAALGSIETESGNQRNARKLLRQSLIAPNENSVAQVDFLNRRHLGDGVDTSKANPPLLHEAAAWQLFYSGDFHGATTHSLAWLQDQPFASAPASLSTYLLADFLGDYALGEKIARASLRSNPDDHTLLNNLAVCLIEQNELDPAEKELERIQGDGTDKQQRIAVLATQGKLAFRRGLYEDGRNLYLASIKRAIDQNMKEVAARAAIHLAMEEFAAGTDSTEEAIQRLKEFREFEEKNEVAALLNRFKKQMEVDAAD